MLAFDVSREESPALLTNIVFAGGGWANDAAPFATNGLVYVSHAQWSFPGYPVYPMISPPPVATPVAVSKPSPPAPTPVARPLRAAPRVPGRLAAKAPARSDVVSIGYEWSESNCLDVVDFTIPASPVVRNPVAIPGALAGVSRGGNIIYTLSMSNSLDALAYDGLNAWLVATLPFTNSWLPPALVSGETVFIAQPGATGTNQLQSWTLTDAGAFSLLGSLAVDSSFDTLDNFGPLLVGQSGDVFSLFDATNPASIAPIGGAAPSGCFWPSASGADGALGAGLWVPLGDYGVLPVPVP
jgi:hypothetical protein